MGNPPSSALNPPDLTRMLGSIDSSNFAEKALGFGKMRHGENVGVLKAVCSEFALSATTPNDLYTVAHNLGHIPTMVMFMGVQRPPDQAAIRIHAVCTPVNQDKWTATTVQVEVLSVGFGSLDRCVGKLMVGGE